MYQRLLALLAATVLVVLAVPTPASAAPDGSFHRVPNRDWTDVCLEVEQARGWDGARVVVGYCSHNGLNQQWRTEQLGSYHRLIVQHSGKCLAVANASHNDGAQIVQRSCDSADASQQWRLILVSQGYYQLVARHSGKCLDKNWWNVVQWNCHGAFWQQWRL